MKGFICRKVGCGRDYYYLIYFDEGNGNRNGICFISSNLLLSVEDSGVVERFVMEWCSFLVLMIVRVNLVNFLVFNDFIVVLFSDFVIVGVVRVSWLWVCFKVVLVKIIGSCGIKEIIIYVFLDSGLDVIFCFESLV